MIKTPQGDSLLAQLAGDWADRLVIEPHMSESIKSDPASWIQEHFLIDRPREPVTGAMLQRGPIRLAEYQQRVLQEAMSRDGDGKLKYSTVVWSEPKKSGKTALAAAAGLYMGQMIDAANIYCMANDGKQSQDRIFNAMARCITLHNKMGGIYVGMRAKYSPPTIILPNGSKVEAVPCDAAGEAGAEPLMTIWSEMWGYAQQHKERMWTEMTIPPTLYGYAMRWVESYAGYEGESSTLWTLYDVGVNNGRRHSLFPDLPVYVNDDAGQLTFWSHEPLQPWQTKEYYKSEAQLHTPAEFRRVHKNEWVTSTSALFDDILLWDRCVDPIAGPLLPGDSTPVIVALDAGYAGASSALYVVSRHPDDAWDAPIRRVVRRYSIAHYPPKGGKLNLTDTLEKSVRHVCKHFNVYCIVYDPYQLHKMCTDLRLTLGVPVREFNQAGRRLQADRQFYDMIIHKQFLHDGNEEDRKHVMNTAKHEQGRNMRFVPYKTGAPIDLTVAAAMATDECLRLNI